MIPILGRVVSEYATQRRVSEWFSTQVSVRIDFQQSNPSSWFWLVRVSVGCCPYGNQRYKFAQSISCLQRCWSPTRPRQQEVCRGNNSKNREWVTNNEPKTVLLIFNSVCKIWEREREFRIERYYYGQENDSKRDFFVLKEPELPKKFRFSRRLISDSTCIKLDINRPDRLCWRLCTMVGESGFTNEHTQRSGGGGVGIGRPGVTQKHGSYISVGFTDNWNAPSAN